MRKSHVILLPIFLLAITASADTIIPGGDVSGVWDVAGSPYIIEGDISIQSGDTLIVEPEVEIRFNADVLMWVRGGYLQADGTTGPGIGDTIRFTSNLPDPQPGDWDGFRVSEYGSAVMTFCSFKFGDLFHAYDNDLLEFTDCTFGFPLSGEPYYLTMLRCAVTVNQTFYGGQYLTLDQCTFSGYLDFQEGPGATYSILGCSVIDDLRLLDYAATFTVTNTTVGGDLPITGEGTSYLTSCHIDGHVSGADVTQIDDCYIGSGIYWYNGGESGRIDLTNSTVEGDITIGDWIYSDVLYCTIVGDILLDHCRDLNLEENTIQGSISGNQSSMADWIQICNNQIIDGGVEIDIYGIGGITVSGNHFTNPPADGIRVDSYGDGGNFINNVITGAAGHGIAAVFQHLEAGVITCNKNIISSCGGDGIFLDLNGYPNWSTWLDIYRNSIYSAGGSGINLIVGGAGEILFSGVNNIIASCGQYGWYTSGWPGASPEYGDVWNNASGNYGGGFGSGPGSISLDPQFVDPENDDLNLRRISPCIDTGDPTFTSDPDGTRSDMGALYFHQDMPVKLTLTPTDPPVVIPETGGEFELNIEVTNRTEEVQSFDFWSEIELPGWGSFEIMAVTGLSLAVGDTVDRDRTQTVPAFAPAGTYTYLAYVGTYPWIVDDYYYFYFEKEGSGAEGSLGTASDWLTTGESFDDVVGLEDYNQPSENALLAVYPNPFNAATVLSYHLRDASMVNLSVYDIGGRKVAELVNGWQDAGEHEAVLNGSCLPSGVYLMTMDAGEVRQIQKVTLIK